MSSKAFCYDYPRPALTVDIALWHWQKSLSVLLIQRKNPPFANTWALPGGFVDANETASAAAQRELHEETGLAAPSLHLCGAFSEPNRDPRSRTVSLVFTAFINEAGKPRGQDDAQAAAWFPVATLPPLAFDHEEIIVSSLAFWRLMLAALPASVGLFPQTWPLKKLQQLANYFHSYSNTP
jgi:8-oxo-dGTP diphosphatase